MTLPNFLVIGESKAGTTSLHQYLGEHPEVFVSAVKELNYFAYDGEADAGAPEALSKPHLFPVHTLDEYAERFSACRGEKAIGEVSPRYLSHPTAAKRIHATLPDVRLVAVLRDPVERAWSNHLMMVREGAERRSLAEAIRDEDAGRNAEFPSTTWHYVERGFHARHLRRYFENFPRDRIAVYLYDDLVVRPEETLRNVFRFIGVDDTFTPNLSARRNVSGVPKNEFYQRLFRNSAWKRRVAAHLPGRLLAPLKVLSLQLQQRNLVRPKMPADVRRDLCARYRADVADLAKLIDRDLSCWLNE